MRHLPWKESCWAIATLLLLAALYVFAYWLTATPESEMLALPDGGEFPFPVFDEMIVDPPPVFVDATKIVGEQTVPERSARVRFAICSSATSCVRSSRRSTNSTSSGDSATGTSKRRVFCDPHPRSAFPVRGPLRYHLGHPRREGRRCGGCSKAWCGWPIGCGVLHRSRRRARAGPLPGLRLHLLRARDRPESRHEPGFRLLRFEHALDARDGRTGVVEPARRRLGQYYQSFLSRSRQRRITSSSSSGASSFGWRQPSASRSPSIANISSSTTRFCVPRLRRLDQSRDAALSPPAHGRPGRRRLRLLRHRPRSVGMVLLPGTGDAQLLAAAYLALVHRPTPARAGLFAIAVVVQADVAQLLDRLQPSVPRRRPRRSCLDVLEPASPGGGSPRAEPVGSRVRTRGPHDDRRLERLDRVDRPGSSRRTTSASRMSPRERERLPHGTR